MVALWLTAFGDGKSFAFEFVRIRLCNDVLGDVLMLPDLGHNRDVGVANIISPMRNVYGIEFSHDGTIPRDFYTLQSRVQSTSRHALRPCTRAFAATRRF